MCIDTVSLPIMYHDMTIYRYIVASLTEDDKANHGCENTL